MSAKIIVLIACAALCALILGAFLGAILVIRHQDKSRDELFNKYVEAISIMEKVYENPEQSEIIFGEYFKNFKKFLK